MSDSPQEKNLEVSLNPQRLSNQWRLKYHQQAMARIAQGTAVTIATLLSIPDAIALIPSSSNLLSWGLKVLHVWLVALILWFAGFYLVLHLVRWLSKGIEIGEDGLKLWRFSKLISWSQIYALGLERQTIFSKLFFLKPPARRLTLYLARKPGGRLTPQYIASFFYLSEEFDRLFLTICQRRFGFTPCNLDCLICPATNLGGLKKVSEIHKWQRVLLSFVIAFSLTLFLGRKAIVNFLYGSANKSFATQEYDKAINLYRQSIQLDPTFAPAWHNLASAEYKVGNFEQATAHWQRALFLKPDFVEPKISLAHLCIQQRQFSLATNLLEHALRLAPTNTAALVNLADLKMQRGDTTDAIKLCRQVLVQEPNNPLANCLLAQGKLRLNKPKEALKVISPTGTSTNLKFHEPFCQLVMGEILLSLGRVNEATSLFEAVLKDNPQNAEALLDLGRAKITRGELQAGDDLIYQAQRLAPYNPWPQLLRAELQLKVHDRDFAQKLLTAAISQPNQDALSLVFAAKLSLKLGNRRQATRLAQMSLHMMPDNREALSIMGVAHSNHNSSHH